MAILPPDPIYCLRHVDMGPVNCLCFQDSERLFAGTLNGNVHLWDLQTNRSALQFRIDTEPIQKIHHTATVLVTQEKGGQLRTWAPANSAYVRIGERNTEHFGFCRIEVEETEGTDGTIAAPGTDGLIELIDLKEMQLKNSLTPLDDCKLGQVMCLKYFGNYLIAGYESCDFLTWDLRTSKVLHRIKLDDNAPLAVDYNESMNLGCYASASNQIGFIAYDRSRAELCQRYDPITIKNAGINCVRIRNDQKVFATGGWDGRIRIFSLKSRRPLAVLVEHKNGGILDIAYSPSPVSMWRANIMAVAGHDGQITLWDLYK